MGTRARKNGEVYDARCTYGGLMRLYLSSFRVGEYPERLLRMADAAPRVALVPNALDHVVDPAVRGAGLQRDLDDLTSIGLTATELDLREPRAAARLEEFDVIWVRGGNIFALREALALSGSDVVLSRLIRSDEVVYGGYSAGACVLAPDLRGLEMVDDPGVVREPIWAGLGILDRPFVPHVRSPGHPETADSDALAAAFAEAGRTHWALRDGDVLVVDNGTTELLRGRSGPLVPSSVGAMPQNQHSSRPEGRARQ